MAKKSKEIKFTQEELTPLQELQSGYRVFVILLVR